ncbi:MAG: hypothetical protein ACE147_04105 [Candidatus Methylomirabilales bacterium]
MQAYEVEFTPGKLSPLQIKDGMQVKLRPTPHVALGDPETPGRGVRIPLTARLAACLNGSGQVIAHAKAYRDPKSGRIVLGVEQADEAETRRALVLLSTSTGFPNGVSIAPPRGLALLAEGELGTIRQYLLIWPDGAAITVIDEVRDERHELRRIGDEFSRTPLA